MGDHEENGTMHDNKVYAVAVSSVVCDATARDFLKRIKGHSGYSGYDKCTQPGMYYSKMTFPMVDAHIRTNVTHLHETSRMSAGFVFRYGPKCMGGVILPILVLLHL